MGAPDLLCELQRLGFLLASDAGGGVRVRPSGRLTDDQRDAIRANRQELMALLDTPDPDRWCWPKSNAMNGLELETFAARNATFLEQGVPTDAAEALADSLVVRDRERDDRALCYECSHWRPGRCTNHVAAGLAASNLAKGFPELLQRCAGFRTHRAPARGNRHIDPEEN